MPAVLRWLFVDVVSRRSIRFPLVSEGVKVTSCLVLTEAAKQPGLGRQFSSLRVGEFEVATSGEIWVAVRDSLAVQVWPDNADNNPQVFRAN
jgi:hypothetical protein